MARLREQVTGQLQPGAIAMIEEDLKLNLGAGNNMTVFSVEGKINDALEIERLIFRWQSRDGEREQQIRITAKQSNLVPESRCLYFVCPHSGRICRKLFTDGVVLTSRYSFKHTYSQRNHSHKFREYMKRYGFYLFVNDTSNVKGRRVRYRGKLTPFGRKLAKMEKRAH
ncbi:MAG: hypothetical protein II683_07975 [Muribaculaceae bacterium]|nr:hypothetical protein [Muribaculaceae bacterium]